MFPLPEVIISPVLVKVGLIVCIEGGNPRLSEGIKKLLDLEDFIV